MGLADFFVEAEAEGEGESDTRVAEGDGSTGSCSKRGELVTSGFAAWAPRPPSRADIMPVAVPTATTTEAAATIALRRAARRRSALRAARRWARKPDTCCPFPAGDDVPPFWGSAGPADTPVSL
ncbi:hypothetical protein GCM10022403_015940 [Streptomyces coacervatus]|uniref:Uncharacterized protein n=1 Tax=Streptomyces coacervatus TaxID=647381 RepID=A0ABP7H1V2_9ACTN